MMTNDLNNYKDASTTYANSVSDNTKNFINKIIKENKDPYNTFISLYGRDSVEYNKNFNDFTFYISE